MAHPSKLDELEQSTFTSVVADDVGRNVFPACGFLTLDLVIFFATDKSQPLQFLK